MKNFLKNFSLLALALTIIVSSCTFQDDDVLPTPPPRNYTVVNTGDVNVNIGGDTTYIHTVINVGGTVVNNRVGGQSVVFAAGAFNITQNQTTGDVTLTANNQNSNVNHGDTISVVVNNNDTVSFVVNTNLSVPVLVKVVDSSSWMVINNNNPVFDIVNTNTNTNTNNQSVLVEMKMKNTSEWNFSPVLQNNLWLAQFLPVAGDPSNPDSIGTPVGINPGPLMTSSSHPLRQYFSGVPATSILSAGTPLNLRTGTGQLTWFMPADSLSGLFYAIAQTSSIDCAADSFSLRVYSPAWASDSADLRVRRLSTANGNQPPVSFCENMSVNNNNITIARYFPYRVMSQTDGMNMVTTDAFSIRSNLDLNQGKTLKTFVNPDPTTYQVVGIYLFLDGHTHTAFIPEEGQTSTTF